MCNRAAQFDITEDFEEYNYSEYVDFSPRYHTFSMETKHYEPKLSLVLPDKHFYLGNWGLIPENTKNRAQADIIKKGTVQAKAESLWPEPKKSFENALVKKRFCLVPVNGFYEHHTRFGKSFPHYIQLKDKKAFSIAGIYDYWFDPDTKEKILSFGIVTCPANKLLARIHNEGLRMPVILRKEDEMKWLKGDLSLLKPYDTDLMDGFSVDKLAGKKEDVNSPNAIEKHFYPELQIEQASLF